MIVPDRTGSGNDDRVVAATGIIADGAVSIAINNASIRNDHRIANTIVTDIDAAAAVPNGIAAGHQNAVTGGR